MVDNFNIAERALESIWIPHIADHEFRMVRQPRRFPSRRAVNLRIQIVEDAHAVAALDERIDQMASHEARTAGNQNFTSAHPSPPPL